MYSTKEPFITSKYAIEVPTHLYYSTPCVYKITVGSKFYIGKCQSLPQTMQQIATQVERSIRTRSNDPSGWFYHLIAYAIKNRVMKAKVERMHDEVKDKDCELLILEQQLLDKNKNNPDCLNNNFDVYIPKWVKQPDLDIFNKWKQDESNKKNNSKNRASNTRKKH